jgi:hypothetical protein
MPTIRGTPDDHLLARIAASDEIAALEGNGLALRRPGRRHAVRHLGRNFPTSGVGRDLLPIGSGTFPRRGRDAIQDVPRTADDFVL